MQGYYADHSPLTYGSRFLLPALHIKLVLEMPTRYRIRKALEALPTDLYDSFQVSINRIKCSGVRKAELGMRILMWVYLANRPLKLAELQHALAVEKSHTEFNADNVPSQQVLLDSCLGLVVVDKETLTVRFVHYTLEEYFRNDPRAGFPNGHSYIAETCLTYVNFGNLRQHCTTLDSLKEKMNEYVFLNYAALYWGNHVQQQPSNKAITKLAKALVSHESGCPPCAIQVLYSELHRMWQSTATKFSGIHLTAYFGLSEYMGYFPKAHMNMKDDSNRTPLSWAAEYGHESIVQMLIETDDIAINASDKGRRTPLSWAAGTNQEAVVRLLIECDDINIDAKDMDGRTPQLWATEEGYEAIVQLLKARRNVRPKHSVGPTRPSNSISSSPAADQMAYWYCVRSSLHSITTHISESLTRLNLVQRHCGYGPHDPALHMGCIMCGWPLEAHLLIV